MDSLFENIRLALDSLRINKLRAALTMLGITIGVAAVVVLVSVGQGVENFVREQFQGIGANLIFVVGAQDGFNRPRPLTQDDLEAISDPFRVPDADIVMPQLDLRNQSVIAPGRESQINVQGVTPEFLETQGREVTVGRFFDNSDLESLARVVVIGTTTVERLFPDSFPVGQSIRINGVRFNVIGVLEDTGGGGFGPPGSDADNVIVMPLTTAQTRLSGERIVSGDRPISQIWVKARDSTLVDSTAQQIRQTLREERGISFRDDDDFSVFTQAELLDSFGNITGLLTLFLGLLAGISLLVGGIGIMNIMLVTVTERTREIGLRKAVGAQRRDILQQFLIEAVVLALAGGTIGVALALAATSLASLALPDLSPTVQLSSVALATIISAAIGIFFGLYPANRAAALNPIDALRYE